MKTCTHDWIVEGIADVDDDVMEIDGHLDLRCAACGQRARILRPTYAECWQVTKDWLFDSVAYWRGEAGGRLVMLEVESPPPDDDLLTANDDDELHPTGTMGRLETAGGDDHHDEVSTSSCKHIWFITATYGTAGEAAAELQCTWCGKFATVMLTDDECETMGKAWEMGLCLEWDRNCHRVTLNRDMKLPAVADLVNGLDLFEGDDDVPF